MANSNQLTVEERQKAYDKQWAAKYVNVAPQLPPRGTFLCCPDTVPEMKVKDGTAQIKCPSCGRTKGTWGTSPAFLRRVWNNQEHTSLLGHFKPDAKFFRCEGPRMRPVEFSISGYSIASWWKGTPVLDGANHWDFEYPLVISWDEKDVIFYDMFGEETHKLDFHPPKSGGSISWSNQSTCYSDGDEHRMKPDVYKVNLHGLNRKWIQRITDQMLIACRLNGITTYWPAYDEKDNPIVLKQEHNL